MVWLNSTQYGFLKRFSPSIVQKVNTERQQDGRRTKRLPTVRADMSYHNNKRFSMLLTSGAVNKH